MHPTGDELDRAAGAIEAGDLVVYPTETVYGLGADAADEAAVEAVFDAKAREQDRPLSMALPSLDAVEPYARLTARERAFFERFLPGPVTVVVERTSRVPDALTAGEERVGIRIPDHEVAQALLERVAPITATSANLSGAPSARTVVEVDGRILSRVAVVLDDGETPGGGSTVVDVERGTIHRDGPMADPITAWLEAN